MQAVAELDIVTGPALEQTLRDAELRAPLVVLDLGMRSFSSQTQAACT